MTISSVCVFCGSKAGSDPAFEAAARDLGRLLAEAGMRLVYGGLIAPALVKVPS